MSVINPVKPSHAALLSSDAAEQPVDERIVRTIQQQYQASHQEEFLQLRAQAEALLTELKTLAVHDGSGSELAL